MTASPPPSPATPFESVSGEALHILRSLRENGLTGRSNKLAEVKSSLERNVSLDFDTYFFFLRKFHYIAMDREAQLKLTDEGEAVVDGARLDQFEREVGQFFGESSADDNTQSGPHVSVSVDPGPLLTDAEAHTDFVMESDVPVSLPPPPRHSAPIAPSIAPVSAPAAASPARAPEPAKGTDLDSRYTKFDALGNGPLGTVYQAKQNALGLDVCVKELKDIFGYFSFLQRGEVQKRLRKELCAQAQVRHPGVVAVLDQNADAQRPYFVLELLNGTLQEQLTDSNGKGLPPAQAIRVFLQLCYGLRAAHAQGLTHHNIKPTNVLFDARGNAKLGDFGLSRVVEVDASRGMPQVFVGTGGMSYLAPELLQKSKDAGSAADVYAVGILLYEMLTGTLPGRRSPLPSEVNAEAPAKLDVIFDKMTQDKLDQRYPDFDAVLTDFYAAFSDREYLKKGDLILSSDPA